MFVQGEERAMKSPKRTLSVEPVDVSQTFWGSFTSSAQLEDFFRPVLERAAASQDRLRAAARAKREAEAQGCELGSCPGV